MNYVKLSLGKNEELSMEKYVKNLNKVISCNICSKPLLIDIFPVKELVFKCCCLDESHIEEESISIQELLTKDNSKPCKCKNHTGLDCQYFCNTCKLNCCRKCLQEHSKKNMHQVIDLNLLVPGDEELDNLKIKIDNKETALKKKIDELKSKEIEEEKKQKLTEYISIIKYEYYLVKKIIYSLDVNYNLNYQQLTNYQNMKEHTFEFETGEKFDSFVNAENNTEGTEKKKLFPFNDLSLIGKTPQIKMTLGFLGSSAVGKTNMCDRIDKGTFNAYGISSIGISRLIINREISIDDKNYIVQITIVDTVGQERFRCLSGSTVKQNDIVLIVYDISDKITFEDVDFWTGFFKDNSGKKNASIYLVGNKLDLPNREVSYEEGSEKAKDLNISWGGECTCKDLNNYSLESLFEKIVIEKAKEKIASNDLYGNCGIKLEDQKKIEKRKNCAC